VYERYLNGRGGDHEVYTRASHRHAENERQEPEALPPLPPPSPPPPPERTEPEEVRSVGLFKGGNQIGQFLKNLHFDLDTGDILLMIIIVFLLMESDDEEIIIVLALILLFGHS